MEEFPPMGILGKFISVLLHIILPPRIREAVLNRIERTKTVLTEQFGTENFLENFILPYSVAAFSADGGDEDTYDMGVSLQGL